MASERHGDLDLLLASCRHWKCQHASGVPAVERDLSTGLSNKSCLLRWGEQRFVLRLFTRKNAHFADLASEIEISHQAEVAGMAPRQVYYSLEQKFVVSEYIEGAHWTTMQARDPQNIQRLVALLKRIHLLPGGDRQLHLRNVMENYRKQLAGTQFEAVIAGEWQGRLKDAVQELQGTIEKPVLCHNDLVPGNIIDTGGQLYVIDWEYAALGDPLYEIAVIALNHQLSADEIQLMLLAYFGDLNQSLRKRFEMMFKVALYIDCLWYAAQSVKTGNRRYADQARAKFENIERL